MRRFSPVYTIAASLLVYVTLAAPRFVSAQSSPLSSDILPPKPSAGHDYVKGVNETVNPATGTVSVTIQLPVPASRGLSLPFALTYSSGDVHHPAVEYFNGGEIIALVMDGTQPTPDRSINGWNDTIPYASAASWVTHIPPNPDGEEDNCDITASYMLHDPTGQTHQLGISAISNVHHQAGAFPAQDPYCENKNSFGTHDWNENGYTGRIVGGTCNGSGGPIGVVAPGCESAAPAFNATDLDGTTYSFIQGYVSPSYGSASSFPTMFPAEIEDRNGNIINIAPGQPDGQGNKTPTVVTDTAGRAMVQLNYQPGATSGGNVPTPQSYVVGGLTYSLAYGTTSANFTVPSVQVAPMVSGTTCSAKFTANYTGKPVIESITLPNGQSYSFHYDPQWGVVDEIHYPNGGWVKYTWKYSDTYSDFVTFASPQQDAGSSTNICNYEYEAIVVDTRTVYYSENGGAVQTQQFTYGTTWDSTDGRKWTGKTTTVVTTDNVTGKSSKKQYQFVPSYFPQPPGPPLDLTPQIPVEQTVTTKDWGPGGNGPTILIENRAWSDPEAMTAYQQVLASGRSFGTAFLYDLNDRITEKDEYDFNQSQTYRRTTYGYLSSVHEASGLSSPCMTITYDASGNRVAETDAYYDGGSTPCSTGSAPASPVNGGPLPSNTHDETNYGSGVSAPRGNVTKVVRWLSSGISPTTTYTYDETGQRTSMTEPCGTASCPDVSGTAHTTTYSYTDSPAGGNSPGNSNAYLTQIIGPSTSGVGHSSSYTYDYESGFLSSSTDENLLATNYTYADALRRLTKIQGPPVPYLGNARPVTNFAYDDSTPAVTKSILQGGSTYQTTYSKYDGLGHLIEQDSGGDPVIVTTVYNGMGNVASVTNPHLNTPNANEDGTTLYAYDSLGRTTIITEPDSSTKEMCYDGVTSTPTQSYCPGQGAGLSSGTWVDYKDEDGHHKQATSDAFGRSTAVLEPDPTSGALSLKTTYAYDYLNDLTGVTQSGAGGDSARVRSFKYDALSRLTNVCNPEALQTGSTSCGSSGPWSQSYAYDANGNVQARTDAKNVVTTYTYDDLNRVTAKNYSDGNTLNAYFSYDMPASGTGFEPAPPDVGHMTYEWTSPSTTNQGIADPNQVTFRFYDFDELGRVINLDDATLVPGGPSDGYGGGPVMEYDLAGNLSVYDIGPNGTVSTPAHKFDYAYDTSGRVTSIVLGPDTPGLPSVGVPTSIPTTIFKSVASGSQPAYSAMGLEHAQFAVNSSSQPMMSFDHSFTNRGLSKSSMYTTGAGAVGGAGSQAYSYQATYTGSGSIAHVTDSVLGTIGNGVGGNVMMDNLNRLTSLKYSGGAYGGITAAWTYDSFGNQLSQTLSGSSSTPVPGNTTTHYNAQNHITFTSRNGNALPYDNNGNLTSDVQYSYAYDAENRLCAIKMSNAYKIYVYDAEGNRIAKGNITPSGTPAPDVSMCSPLKNNFSITQAYVMGLNGEELENYTPGSAWHNTNVYMGGTEIATYAGSYMDVVMTDWQGTRRAQLRNNVGMSGIVDFLTLPYGDGFTMVGGSNFDSLVQSSGHQYDQEDNLYNFGARYYGDWVGRFMSPDFNAADDDLDPVPYADLNNPQSLNLYSYVQNNPLSHKDADGHNCDGGSVGPDGTFTFHCTNDPPPNSNGTVYQLAGALGAGFAPETGGASLGIAAGFVGAMLAAEYLAAHPIHLSSSNDPAPTPPGAAPTAPVPSGLVGTQDGKSGQAGGRHNSGPLDPAHGGSGDAARDFNTLTGGKAGPAPAGSNYPPGTQVGDNGISLRPARGNSGPRIDIPANGDKPHETLHYPN